jgi:hypothetical protein
MFWNNKIQRDFYEKENYINIDRANQLLIPNPSIIEKKSTFGNGQYEIKDLQLTIDDYKIHILIQCYNYI